MALLEKINSDLKEAMKAKDSVKVGTLRMVVSDIKYAKIEKMKEMDDGDIIAVIQKAIKSRKDSAEQYKNAQRPELAMKEEAEIAVLEVYLPEQMSSEEIEKIIRSVVRDIGATGAKDMGKVMQKLMPLVKGKADGKLVNEIVKKVLG